MSTLSQRLLTNYQHQPVAFPEDAGALARLSATVQLWRRRAQSRRQLALLGERDLRDIGLTRVDAWQELKKPFWRA
jgi:uncharacterized protein YjiS (DUF1127 family)